MKTKSHESVTEKKKELLNLNKKQASFYGM